MIEMKTCHLRIEIRHRLTVAVAPEQLWPTILSVGVAVTAADVAA